MTPCKARPARILFAANDARTFLSHRLPVARAAQGAGHDVHVALPPSSRVSEIEAQGYHVHALDLSRRGTNPFHEAATWRAFVRLYRKVRPDLVHHVTIKPIVYGGLAAREARVPAAVHAVTGLGFVFTSDSARARALRPLVSAAYRRAFAHRNCRIVFQNQDDMDMLVRARVAPPEKCVLIRGSGVDVAKFAATPPPAGVPLVVLPARMLWDKGVGEFVEAARQLRARGVAARFALVGDVDENPESIPRDQLEDWAKEGVVEWWGWRRDMLDVYRQASIVCLPSYREGVPRALIEAASCERALVATDVPGCRDVVEHERNGLLVPPRDTTALAVAIERLVRDEEERTRMGARGREIVLQEFTEERVVRATLQVYDGLLARIEG